MAIVLVIAFALPYIGKNESNPEQMIDFGFKSSNTFLSVQQGKPFVFVMNAGQNVNRIELSLNGNLVKSWAAEEKRVWAEGEARLLHVFKVEGDARRPETVDRAVRGIAAQGWTVIPAVEPVDVVEIGRGGISAQAINGRVILF